MEKKIVHISYCWKEPSNGIVCNWLLPSLTVAGIDCVLDKEDCGYNEDIVNFEEEIGRGAQVVMVIGKEYLSSFGCMYEAASIVKNGNLHDRLRIVCLDDFNRHDDIYYQQVVDYWINKMRSKKDLADKMSPPANQVLMEEFNRLVLIIENIGKLWQVIRNQNTLTFSNISKDSFKLLGQYINGGIVFPNIDKPTTSLDVEEP